MLTDTALNTAISTEVDVSFIDFVPLSRPLYSVHSRAIISLYAAVTDETPRRHGPNVDDDPHSPKHRMSHVDQRA